MIDIEEVASGFATASVGESLGQVVVRVARDEVVGLTTALRDAGFTTFLDLCAVDYLSRDPRFEVVVTLLAMESAQRVRLLCGISGDDPTMPTLTDVFVGANFYEREAFDLFGIEFAGHPDLTRILLPDEWEGHPLRKDTPVGSVPVQFKGAE